MFSLRLQSNIDRTCNLNRAKLNGKYNIAKPLLFVSIIDLFENNHIKNNQIYFDNHLSESYSKATAKLKLDKVPLLCYPFWHLSSEPFWKIVMKENAGELAGRTVSSKWIRENVAYAELDPMLFESMKIPEERQILKQEILSKYFQPTHKP